MQVIGRFDRKITIQEPDGLRDSATNAPSGNWVNVATIYATKTSKRGRETMQGGGAVSIADEVFTIRYRTDVSEKMRVSYNDVNYEIFDIDEIRRKELLTLYCQKLK